MGYLARKMFSPLPVKLAAIFASLAVTACQAQNSHTLSSSDGNKPEDYDGWTFELLDAKIKANPNEASYYVLRGHLHQVRDERHEAIIDFDKGIKLDPKKGESYIARSEMHTMMANYVPALADASAAIGLMPRSSMPYGQRARIEMICQNYTAAIEDVKQSLQYDPHNLGAISTLSQAYDQLGRPGEALGVANYGVEYGAQQWPDQIYFFYQDRALVLLHAGQYRAANKDLDSGLAAKENHSQLWAYKALLYAMQDDLPKAESALAKLIEYDTFRPRANRLKGEAYRAAGLWKKAIDSYHVSTRLEPTYGPGYMQCGIAQLACGDTAGAAVNFRESIRLVPTSALSHSYLAVALFQSGKESESKAEMDKAFALTENLPGNFVNRARVKFAGGDLKEAARDCLQALALDKYCADAYAMAATILTASHQDGPAKQFSERARALGYHPPLVPVQSEIKPALTAGGVINLPLPALEEPLKPLPFNLIDVDAAP